MYLHTVLLLRLLGIDFFVQVICQRINDIDLLRSSGDRDFCHQPCQYHGLL